MQLVSSFDRRHGANSPNERGLFDAVAQWCDALGGAVPLGEALERLATSLGAEAAMIVRSHRSDMRPCPVAIHDPRGTSAIRPLRVSFADSYFGTAMRAPRSASLWIGSAHADETRTDCSPALKEWQASRRLSEFVVLVLNGSAATRDLIELHFAEPLSRAQLAVLEAITPTICRTWTSRQVGLITRTVINHRQGLMPASALPTAPDMLDVSNPCRLSRAEFRVCVLLSRGLSVAGVAKELGSSEATVRTHLRNIYAKSEISSLAELVFVLLRPGQTPSAANVRCA